MTADIVERLRSAGHFYAPPHDAILYEAAAEIVRLRGEVENITAEAIEWRDKLQASTPEPAMPNGVEEMVAYLDNWLSREHGLNLGRVKVGDAVDAALRAADNRDAAGVETEEQKAARDMLMYGIGIMRDGKRVDSSTVRLEPTPAAVPAGEAVAWLASDGEVFTDKESADRHSKVWGVNPLLTPLYTTPPAPVQAAPQEGEVPQLVRYGRGSAESPYLLDQREDGYWTPWHVAQRELARALAAHPSACELGADGVGLIAAERKRQVTVEGWTAEHDDEYFTGDMAAAAACYAYFASLSDIRRNSPGSQAQVMESWPWDSGWWKPGDRIRELVKAGALIAAEIDRLQRTALQHRGDSRGGEG